MNQRMLTAALAVSALIGAVGTAHAQATTATNYVPAPVFEFSVGYQFLRVADQSTSDAFPSGFAIDGAKYRGPLGIVGEFGWSHDSTDVPGVSVSSSFLHFAGGARLLFVREQRVRPHVQLLGGLAHARSRRQIDLAGITSDVTSSDSAFMVQPGAGVTVVMGDMWGFFGNVDYRRSFFGEGPGLGYGNTNEVRVFVGARMIFD